MHPIDHHVGERIRTRRKSLGVSQQGLATTVGISFQQLQKYESGGTRISASRLFAIAAALGVSAAWFFIGFDGEADAFESIDDGAGRQSRHDFLKTAEGFDLAEAFARISSARHRRRILALIQTLGDE